MSCMFAVDAQDYAQRVSNRIREEWDWEDTAAPRAPGLPPKVEMAIWEANRSTYEIQTKIDTAATHKV
jgi:hypothetical protein